MKKLETLFEGMYFVPQVVPEIQNKTIDALLSKGYEFANWIKPEDRADEEDGKGAAMLTKRTSKFSHSFIQVGPDGSINGEPPEMFLNREDKASTPVAMDEYSLAMGIKPKNEMATAGIPENAASVITVKVDVDENKTDRTPEEIENAEKMFNVVTKFPEYMMYSDDPQYYSFKVTGKKENVKKYLDYIDQNFSLDPSDPPFDYNPSLFGEDTSDTMGTTMEEVHVRGKKVNIDSIELDEGEGNNAKAVKAHYVDGTPLTDEELDELNNPGKSTGVPNVKQQPDLVRGVPSTVIGEEKGEITSAAIEKGTKHEMEHTKDPLIAKKIAMDHLRDDPHYYEKLAKVGLEEQMHGLTDEQKQAIVNKIEREYDNLHVVDWHDICQMLLDRSVDDSKVVPFPRSGTVKN